MFTQDQTDKMIVELLKGNSAEIFASLNPDTGECQVIVKSEPAMASCILLSQIVERLAKNGIPADPIRAAVELGLNPKMWSQEHEQ
ncbi:MAG: hypothetical protein FWG31_00800 [Oscillospiraceae bacterium]|nr:hypothetical protein [Oscillospiraceae bacterium]